MKDCAGKKEQKDRRPGPRIAEDQNEYST
jgi:hypothetical protein